MKDVFIYFISVSLAFYGGFQVKKPTIKTETITKTIIKHTNGCSKSIVICVADMKRCKNRYDDLMDRHMNQSKNLRAQIEACELKYSGYESPKRILDENDL